MNEKIVSIIIPIYKSEKYLDSCLESVANQTYKDLEIILVDDGSPDNCPQICDEWAKKDDRFKVLHKNNAGVSVARNDALDICSGDYITFVDSDDWIEKDYILDMMSNTGDGVDVVSAGLTYDYLDGNSVPLPSLNGTLSGKDVISYFLLDEYRPEACGKLYKKLVINQNRFDSTKKYSEDIAFNYYVLKNCNKIACINNTMYHYLQESGNSSTTPLMTENRKNSYKVFVEILEDCKNDKEVYACALKQFCMRVFAILTRVLHDKEFTKKYYDEIADVILDYKKDILFCKLASKKYKISVLIMSFSKTLFKKLFAKIYK